LWVLGYGLVGLAGAVVVGEAGLDTARSRPSQWETVSVYVPLGLFLPVIGWQDLHGGISSSMGLGGTLLGCVLVVRQLLVVAENNRLASTLEARVDQRTAELRSREAHFRSIVTSISDVVLVLDTESHTMSYQTPAVHVLGYEAGELVGVQLDELVHPDDLERHSATFHAREETIGQVYLSRMRHRDGTWRYMEARVTELLDHPDMRGLLIVLRDVGDRVVLEERLRHQAYHDALTGLANRSLLVEELDSALERGEQPSLIVLDLDEFKAVNDTAGHDLGDEVLVAVARRLKHATRPGDLVARLGGDEFAVLVPDDPDALGAMAIAERALRALRLPLTVKQRSIRCLGSVGVAVATVGSSAARLLRDADVAMYVAKAGGKGRVERFTPRMRAELLRRQALEDLVRHAVVDRRLVLHFQPVVDLESGAPVGAEALLRLRDGEGGLVSPVEFVPIAEELGLIGEIGECVLYEACRAAAGWQLPGRPITVAVNVSTRQLRDGHLVGQVATALEQSGLEPELLTLEITEGALGADVDVEATLRSLRVLGVRLSIDDFGAGYSSLGRLRSFPVDELKIDRSFVAELADADDAPLVDAILAMARSLDLRVVAEGIETCGQAASMRERGCTSGQGYLFSPPVPRDEIDALFADRFADLVHARASALAPPTAATASSATTN
jgi:diguanylate cyclase (GGDEF)-like protein/PAS domain S-box-containing protein